MSLACFSAEKNDQWKNGPMKGKNGVTHRNPGEYFSTPNNIKEFILFYILQLIFILKIFSGLENQSYAFSLRY